MLRTFCEIAISFFAVYGMYCAVVTLAYMLFIRPSNNIAIAVFKKNGELVSPKLRLAKKAFLGHCRSVILIDSSCVGITNDIVTAEHTSAELYSIERIQKDDRSVQQ